MTAEPPRPESTQAAARPRELWPAATLGTMMLLILVLSVHLVVVSARLGPADTQGTYADGAGTGVVATLGVARIATGE